jgi:hypothetical protein
MPMILGLQEPAIVDCMRQAVVKKRQGTASDLSENASWIVVGRSFPEREFAWKGKIAKSDCIKID